MNQMSGQSLGGVKSRVGDLIGLHPFLSGKFRTDGSDFKNMLESISNSGEEYGSAPERREPQGVAQPASSVDEKPAHLERQESASRMKEEEQSSRPEEEKASSADAPSADAADSEAAHGPKERKPEDSSLAEGSSHEAKKKDKAEEKPADGIPVADAKSAEVGNEAKAQKTSVGEKHVKHVDSAAAADADGQNAAKAAALSQSAAAQTHKKAKGASKVKGSGEKEASALDAGKTEDAGSKPKAKHVDSKKPAHSQEDEAEGPSISKSKKSADAASANAASAASRTQAQAAHVNSGAAALSTDSAKRADKNASKLFGLDDGAVIKIEKVTVEKEPASKSAQKADSGADLLKSLASRQSPYAAVAAKLHAVAGNHSSSEEAAAELDKVSFKDLLSAGVKNASAQAKLAESAPKAANESKSGHNGSTANQWQGFDGAAKGAQALGRQAAAPPAHDISKAVNAAQEIMAKMQTAIRGEAYDGQQKLSMDFQVGGLGQVSLSLKQSGDAIAVSLQLGDNAAKDQLMDQRDELERGIKDLGFKEVSLDIGSKGGSGGEAARDERWRRHGGGLGNSESVENVKLGGNDKADLSQILAMSSK